MKAKALKIYTKKRNFVGLKDGKGKKTKDVSKSINKPKGVSGNLFLLDIQFSGDDDKFIRYETIEISDKKDATINAALDAAIAKPDDIDNGLGGKTYFRTTS